MESRIREGQSKLIDVFALLIRSENEDRIDWCYPENGLSEELRRNVAKFAFPFRGNFKSSNVDYFTFVLTDIDGKFKFGFCRMSAGSESTLCLISSYPWFEIFYKILNHLSDALNSTNGSLQNLLDQLCVIDPSAHGKKSLSYKILEKQFTIQYPDPDKLPSIPESRNLTEYYNAIDGQNMLTIFASMLFERRIIVTSHKLSRLTACVYGATSLIYPLNWQHIFIPVLPYHLIDYISAPMPYLIGVHSSVFEMAKPGEIADAMIVDADARRVTVGHEDLTALPVGIVSSLKKDLNLHRNDNHCSLTGDKLSQAFLKAMVSLIGGYRMALVLEGGQIGFDSDIFLNSHPDNMQAFLRMILQSQSFEQFVAERLTVSRFMKGFSDVFERAVLNAETTGKQNKASVKKKFNNLIQDKVLGDIRNKVKSTSVKTFSSVKKKLDFKKSEGVNHVKGKATTATKDFAVQSKTSAQGVSYINSAETDLGNMSGGRQTLPSDLLRQRSASRSSAVEKRDVRFLGDNDYDVLDVWRQQSSSDLSLTLLDRTSLFKQLSFGDLEISGLDLDRDIVNLSSVSFESCHSLSASKTEQTSTEHHGDDSKVIMRTKKVCVNDSDSVCVNGGISHASAAEEEDLEDDSSDGDSLFELPSFENSVVGKSETVARKSLHLLTFPSVQKLQRALQVSNPIRRKAVVSVQELPNVKQMVQRLEASSNPQKSHQVDAPLLDVGASRIAQQTAALSDRKARTSLMRKHAIRATGQTRKASVDDCGEIGIAPMSEKRSSVMSTKSERFHDLIDSVKKERNYISADFDPQPNAFGCLLRVSSRAASIRQFDMQQRQFSCVKRASPPSDHSRKQLQDSRRAIYDSESKTAVAEEVPSQSRAALYIPGESVFETKTDVIDGSFDLPKNEIVVNLPLNRNAADVSFNSTGSFVSSGNRGALYFPREPNPTKDPGSDCEGSSEPSRNRVSLCVPLDEYPAEDAVSFTFRLPGGGSSEDLNDQSALCLQKEEDPRFETEILSGDDWFRNFSSLAYESEFELLSKDITSARTSQLVPENGSVKDRNNAYEHPCLLYSATENGVLKRPNDLHSASHQPQSVDQTKESYENFVGFTIHETPESSDDNSPEVGKLLALEVQKLWPCGGP